MKKKRFFIVKVALIVVISIIIGIGIYNWNSQKVMGSALPMPLGFGVAEVISPSMSPTINVGDVVIVVPQDEYNVNDIVAYEDGNMVVTHRIIGVDENGDFITKGDNPENSVDAMPLKEIYIIGKVVKTFEGVGPVIRVIQSPVISVLILIVAGLLLVLSTKKEKENEDKDLVSIKEQIAALKGETKAPSAEDIQAQIDALKKEAEERNQKGK